MSPGPRDLRKQLHLQSWGTLVGRTVSTVWATAHSLALLVAEWHLLEFKDSSIPDRNSCFTSSHPQGYITHRDISGQSSAETSRILSAKLASLASLAASCFIHCIAGLDLRTLSSLHDLDLRLHSSLPPNLHSSLPEQITWKWSAHHWPL